MGKIGIFFGRPGARPDTHQRAPQLDYDSFVECSHVAVDESEGIDEDKEHHAADKASKLSFGENVSVFSRSDESSDGQLGTVTVERNRDIDTSHGFTGLQKGKTDKVLDKLVAIAGSQLIFYLMWVILIIWIVLGIVYRAPDNWQVVMQDGQSIQSYIWDTLLMRQQLSSTHEQLVICGVLRSRILTFKDLISRKLTNEASKTEEDNEAIEDKGTEEHALEEVEEIDFDANLPVEVWYDRLSSYVSKLIGSLPCMIIFWTGIIIWIICGVKPTPAGNVPPFTGETTGSNPRLKKFSSSWQLYINSATAVVLLVCTVFLQNIRARHDKFSAKFIVDIFETDQKIEYKLRDTCNEFKLDNPVVTIYSKKRSTLEKIIDFYADVVGTGIGVVIAIAVFATWLGVGHLMSYSDDWWLIIGTYTGLIGFLDGFVIRQVYYRIVEHEQRNYLDIAQADLELFELLGIECPKKCDGTIPIERKNTLEFRISSFINRNCSNQWSVIASIGIILGLIIIASALRWSTTGQLLCNTPTMIIEAFFLIVLLQAHNWADQQRRVELTALLARRRILLNHIDRRF